MALLTPIYQTEFYRGVIEKLALTVDVFNAASNGTLLLGSDSYNGDFIREAMYARISGLIRHRDVDSDAAVADVRMALKEHVGVDVAHGLTPVFETYENFDRRGRSVEEFAFTIGEQFAEDFLKTGLEYLTGALIAATGTVANLNDATLNTTAMSTKHIIRGKRMFGDQGSNIRAIMLNSEAYYDLVEDQVANMKIDTIAGVQIATGADAMTFGLPMIISDISTLQYDAGAGDLKNRVLFLTEGAGSVIERGQPRFSMDENVQGLENLGMRFQGETNTLITLKGYAWDTTTGGRNPNLAAISTGANWSYIYDSHKLAPASIVEVESV